MLPFLPAILLLLLQGPAGPERIAHERLTGAIQALHRQIGHSTQENKSVSDEVVFATLLAASSNKGFSQAFLQALDLLSLAPTETKAVAVLPSEDRSLIPAPASLGAPSDGFFACRRSRDGPAA